MGASSGNGEARIVRDALLAAGFDEVFDIPVAPWLCREPIVVECAGFGRASLQADGSERGVRSLVLHVCREDPGDAEDAARSLARGVHAIDWAHADAPDGLRAVTCDAGQPVPGGRDSSGRWLWDVPVELTVVVSV